MNRKHIRYTQNYEELWDEFQHYCTALQTSRLAIQELPENYYRLAHKLLPSMLEGVAGIGLPCKTLSLAELNNVDPVTIGFIALQLYFYWGFRLASLSTEQNTNKKKISSALSASDQWYLTGRRFTTSILDRAEILKSNQMLSGILETYDDNKKLMESEAAQICHRLGLIANINANSLTQEGFVNKWLALIVIQRFISELPSNSIAKEDMALITPISTHLPILLELALASSDITTWRRDYVFDTIGLTPFYGVDASNWAGLLKLSQSFSNSSSDVA